MRARHFAPTLDALPARIAPSDGMSMVQAPALSTSGLDYPPIQINLVDPSDVPDDSSPNPPPITINYGV